MGVEVGDGMAVSVARGVAAGTLVAVGDRAAVNVAVGARVGAAVGADAQDTARRNAANAVKTVASLILGLLVSKANCDPQ
jgi:hypothetical protein